jgi:hypothetical protein
MLVSPEQAKPVGRRGRKATGLKKIAGLPGKVARFFFDVPKQGMGDGTAGLTNSNIKSDGFRATHNLLVSNDNANHSWFRRSWLWMI